MTARRAALLVLPALLAVVALFPAYTAVRAAGYAEYWAGRAAEPEKRDTFTLVAFGDSATVAVGALDPRNGYVGRAASMITELTGRPVRIVNRAAGGATTGDVLARQLSAMDVASADLVLIGTSNDLEQRVPLGHYRAHLRSLLAVLPAARSVISDLPLLPGRDAYQEVLTQVADEHGVARADFAAVFTGEGRRLDVFSFLPPHLNDRGYGYWFEAFRPHIELIVAAGS